MSRRETAPWSGAVPVPGTEPRPRAVRHSAPGKLFIAGEYAVLEPGHPALLIAVDRHVHAEVSGLPGGSPLARADVVIRSDLYAGEVRWRRGDEAPAGLGHVVSAIAVVDELLAAGGLPSPPIHVTIESDLHRGGTKIGLGSSGAVTVAVVSAVAAYAGLALSPEERFRLALVATARHSTRASGGDLAASVWGGWIAYRAPDRAAVLDLVERSGIAVALRVPWPGFGVRRLPPPRGLELAVGWTGEPASTGSLAGRLGAGEWSGSASHRTFVARSDACVHAAVRALERGAGRELMHQVRVARLLLANLDAEVQLGIFTARLTALCEAAEAVGGAAKPSGAGGGDCGLAFLDAAAHGDVSQLRKEWAAAGVLPLPIRVEPMNGSEQ